VSDWVYYQLLYQLTCFAFACSLGLSGSVLLRSGQLSGLIAQLQELLKGVDDAEILPGRYDAALIAAQVHISHVIFIRTILLYFSATHRIQLFI